MVNVNYDKLKVAFAQFEVEGSTVERILSGISNYSAYRSKIGELLEFIIEEKSRVDALKNSVGWTRTDGFLTKAMLSNRINGSEREALIDIFDDRKDEPTDEPVSVHSDDHSDDNSNNDELIDELIDEANDEEKTDAFETAVPLISSSELTNRSITRVVESDNNVVINNTAKIAKAKRSTRGAKAEKSNNISENSASTSSKTQYIQIDEVDDVNDGELDELKNKIEHAFTELSSVVWKHRPFNLGGAGASKVFNKIASDIPNGITIAFSDPEFDWERGECKCRVLASSGSKTGHTAPLKCCTIGQRKFIPTVEAERTITELFAQYRERKSSKMNTASANDENAIDGNELSERSIYLPSAIKRDGNAVLAPKKPDFSIGSFDVFVRTVIGKLILQPIETRGARNEFTDLILDYTWLIASHPAIASKLNSLWNKAKLLCEQNTEDINAEQWREILSSKQWQNAIILGVQIKSNERTKLRNLIATSYDAMRTYLRPIAWLFGPFAAKFVYTAKPNLSRVSDSIKQKHSSVTNSLTTSFMNDDFIDWFARVDISEDELDFTDCENGEYFLTWPTTKNSYSSSTE